MGRGKWGAKGGEESVGEESWAKSGMRNVGEKNGARKMG